MSKHRKINVKNNIETKQNKCKKKNVETKKIKKKKNTEGFTCSISVMR